MQWLHQLPNEFGVLCIIYKKKPKIPRTNNYQFNEGVCSNLRPHQENSFQRLEQETLDLKTDSKAK